MDSATENNRHINFVSGVRVKTGGKSARPGAVMYLGGKPYREQDKAVRSVVCSDLNVRVCRIERWLLTFFLIKKETESGLLTTVAIFMQRAL